MKAKITFLTCLLVSQIYGQINFNYNFNTTGQRVCLVSASVTENPASVLINLHDSAQNTSQNYTIKKRPINSQNADWVTVASNIPATTTSWTDTNVTLGSAYEYQISRNTGSQIATGYVTACIRYDQSDYKGRMILVIDNSFLTSLATEIAQLKKDLIYEGWFVEELYVNRASTWETEPEIITIKNQITTIYNNAPTNDKPKHLFLLGHIPVPRSGQGAFAPDGHDENKGARGADCYYADIDGVFTDVATYNPGNIDSKAINLPNDLKWDQDFIPSELEMAFGRVDFADIVGSSQTELQLLQSYLNRLHNYRVVASGHDMGNKTAFNFGYDNSNDGSYRSLIPLSGVNNVYQYSGTTIFPLWVNQTGSYQVFMQNVEIPHPVAWDDNGMNSTIFSSDQSYWGYWDDANNSWGVGHIRNLLSKPTKCLGILYTTSAVNLFHQTGMGETMGWSIKRIMDHNQTNNLYQKPEQDYDTWEFWGRTHLQYHGDPTLRLNQVIPPTNVQVGLNNGHLITWNASTDSNIVGYHVYRSYSENGPFVRLTSAPIMDLSFTDGDLTTVIRYYLVKAIKLETTGSGTYLNPSIGTMATNALNVASFSENSVQVFPNPAQNEITITSSETLISIELYDVKGQKIAMFNPNNSINVSNLSQGIYFLKIYNDHGFWVNKKIVKY